MYLNFIAYGSPVVIWFRECVKYDVRAKFYYLSPRLVGTKMTSTSPTRLRVIVIRYQGDMPDVFCA
jgi:hypothetical protein